jgi:endonuclease YncB( thermonuclease family)
MIESILICASLLVVDGDTVKCDGEKLRLLGQGVPFVSGIDTPEVGSRAKCEKERKLALLAKYRLKDILAKDGGVTVVYSGANDTTRDRRKLVDIYDSDGNEIGQKLMKEGFARPWAPKQKINWCA